MVQVRRATPRCRLGNAENCGTGEKAAVENAGQESTDRKVAGRLDRQTHAHRNDRFLQPDNTMISRKSLFTENSVATQKQCSTSINTNKIQSTTIKSITSSFFTKLNYLLHLITKLAKATCCGNVSYYKLILPFLRSQLGRSIAK